MRLLLDAQISGRVAEALRALGHDVLTAAEIGVGDAPDPVVWEAAIAQQRVLVTFNIRDFQPLYHHYWAAGTHHPGLVLISTTTLSNSEIGEMVRALGRVMSRNEDLTDQVIYLERES